jgi:hypothetical protein
LLHACIICADEAASYKSFTWPLYSYLWQFAYLSWGSGCSCVGWSLLQKWGWDVNRGMDPAPPGLCDPHSSTAPPCWGWDPGMDLLQIVQDI